MGVGWASLFTGLVDWTGLDWTGLDSPKNLFFSVGQKLSILIQSLKLLAQPAIVSFFESVEVKGHVIFNKLQ